MSTDPLQRAAVVTGVATSASGLALVAAPRLALSLMGARRGEPAPFLFRIVGMFMATSGGALADAARRDPPSPAALRWAVVTKAGATAMVATGVARGHFARRAAAVAAVDAASAVLLGAIAARARR